MLKLYDLKSDKPHIINLYFFNVRSKFHTLYLKS